MISVWPLPSLLLFIPPFKDKCVCGANIVICILGRHCRFQQGPAKLRPDAPDQSDGCDPYVNLCEAGAVCVDFRLAPPQQRGRCLRATARYVPSYSTRLRCGRAFLVHIGVKRDGEAMRELGP